ncbi:7-carboxy-7-deazaguanine synthase QueE [Ferrimonas marina]|uniref:7-carboxy-7-deazaguanine synthase n=1 Tax=Ferrimonas marina TaxID=299255 RepID=A0A1M5R8N9_9GAMM|nr:7-carboxy-7-deazaguanine synthase QueE [Ferrimonas marina]SHH22704.1 7-carboxy-7-deazaguanine synthase [Ferrimonas marina]
MQYPVNEIFETLQGEGFYTGVPAVFLRLQGCPVGCAWCDTKHTWHCDPELKVDAEQVIGVSGDKGHWSQWPLSALVAHLTSGQYTARQLVITGGEPCLYDLTPLTEAMSEAGWQCQIETSGCFQVRCDANTWVTVSPKEGMKGGLAIQPQALTRANEIKYPVATEQHIDNLKALLATLPDGATPVVALQPISQRPRATKLCIEQCIANNWRLSAQVHKYLQID